MQTTLFIPTLNTTTKYVILIIWLPRNLRLRANSFSQIMQEYCILILYRNICFGYLLESPQGGDSNKYPKHMFFKEIKSKQELSYMSICSLSILYNSKFILMATSLGTNTVLVMMVHCRYLFMNIEDMSSWLACDTAYPCQHTSLPAHLLHSKKIRYDLLTPVLHIHVHKNILNIPQKYKIAAQIWTMRDD